MAVLQRWASGINQKIALQATNQHGGYTYPCQERKGVHIIFWAIFVL
jgi:hypothetical protein